MYYYLHFKDVRKQTQRGQVTCPKSQSLEQPPIHPSCLPSPTVLPLEPGLEHVGTEAERIQNTPFLSP